MSEHDDLDARMKAAGMIPFSSLMSNKQPVDHFMAHTGVRDHASFESWLTMRYESMLRMQLAYTLGDTPKDEMYEWVVAHTATFHEVLVNWRAMKERMAAPPAPTSPSP
jgi:hypothetical protein